MNIYIDTRMLCIVYIIYEIYTYIIYTCVCTSDRIVSEQNEDMWEKNDHEQALSIFLFFLLIYIYINKNSTIYDYRVLGISYYYYTQQNQNRLYVCNCCFFFFCSARCSVPRLSLEQNNNNGMNKWKKKINRRNKIVMKWNLIIITDLFDVLE